MRNIYLCALVMLLFASAAAQAEFEAGIGLSALHVPHYIGSEQADDYLLPFPYLRYRSERLNIDRNLIQGKLWAQGNWSLELSLGGAVRVSSDDNRAREGMEDLDFIGEAGPALHYYFAGDRLSERALFVRLPLRLAVSSDLTFNQDLARFRGVTFNPGITWRNGFNAQVLEQQALVRPQLSLTLRSATRQYHDYTYGVDDEFVTIEREAYQAQSGYGGVDFAASISLRFDHYLLAAFSRISHIQGATFADSPLVRQKHSVVAGLAWAYVF